jgi:hypothetical protein
MKDYQRFSVFLTKIVSRSQLFGILIEKIKTLI